MYASHYIVHAFMQLEPHISNRSMFKTASRYIICRILCLSLQLHSVAAPSAWFVLRQLNNLQIALKISYELFQPYVIFQTECQMLKPFGKKKKKKNTNPKSFLSKTESFHWKKGRIIHFAILYSFQ